MDVKLGNNLKALIGVGAFVIGGLLARESAIEGIELLEEKVNDRIKKKQQTDEVTPAETAE